MDVNNTSRFNEKADESQVNAQLKSEDHKKLIEYGIHESVAARLDEIYKSGTIAVLFNIIVGGVFELIRVLDAHYHTYAYTFRFYHIGFAKRSIYQSCVHT